MHTHKVVVAVSLALIIFSLAGTGVTSSMAKSSVKITSAPAQSRAMITPTPAGRHGPDVGEKAGQGAGIGASETDPLASERRWRQTHQPGQPAIHDPNAPDSLGQPSQSAHLSTGQPQDNGWSQVPAPSAGPADAYLNDVALSSSTNGWAVGYYGSSADLIEHWDGTSWSVVSSPSPDPSYNSLYGVGIVSNAEAYAAGQSAGHPLMLRWDGSAWSRMNGPYDSLDGQFYKVKAIAANDIWAVGYQYSSGYKTLTAHYNGTAWSIVPSPNPDPNNSYLYGVGGSASNDVWAVGYSYNSVSYNNTAFILHWNGSAWSQASIPSFYASVLEGVSAISSSQAWAFGESFDSNYNGYTLILHWDGSSWTQQTSPNGTGTYNYLTGGVAVSASEIWAVGSSSNAPLRLHTTDGGSTWANVSGPTLSGGFSGVAATAANNVIAVGCQSYSGCYHTVAEQWNGSVWSALSSTPNVGELSVVVNKSVALDASHAWVVGYYSDDTPFIFSWNGSAWTVISTTLLPAGANGAFLYDVSATTANDVWAVGSYFVGNSYYNLTLHYDGNTWNNLALPYSYFNSVSAIAANDVWVISYNAIRHYDGTSWGVVSYPSPGGSVNLRMIRALNSNDAWAVGYSYNNGTPTAFTLHYTGGAWSLVPTAVQGTRSYASAVLPISANEAWLGGYYRNSNNYYTLLQHWSGTSNTWTAIDTTSLPLSFIGSISANSANDVWAAGGNILHWDGSAWTVNTPAPLGDYSGFNSVASYGGNFTWGFGYYHQNYTSHPLIELHTNNAPCGASWSVVTSPNGSNGANELLGIGKINQNDIWAVGNYYDASNNRLTLAEHWDGTSWSVVNTPNPNNYSLLFSAAGVISNDVWAVGYSISGTLVEHWNGSAWSVTPSPNKGTNLNALYSVVPLAANNVWAVGSSGTTDNGTLIEHWDGASWTVMTAPSPAGDSELYSISAVSPTDIWAVGYYGPFGTQQTLTEHWNGSAWSIVPSQNLAGNNQLNAVVAVATNDVWAVGSPYQAIIEHWNGTGWTLANSIPAAATAIAAVSANDIWAAGNSTIHWNGTTWSVVANPQPSGMRLNGIAALSTNNVWAVGRYQSGGVSQTLIEHYAVPQCQTPFVDINGNIFYTAIAYLYNAGVVNGTDATHFSPAGTSTRGQFAKVVVLGFSTPLYTPGTPDFTDVPPGYFAYLYIESGFHAGILSGFDSATCIAAGATPPCYLPNRPITRAQLTKLVVNAAHYPLTTPSTPSFIDVPPSNVFYAAVETAHAHGVINGYSYNTFRPNNPIRRDEMCQIVYKGITSPRW